MKRDMDLVRSILLAIERDESVSTPQSQFEGRTAKEVAYHVGLMAEGGLIHAKDVRHHDGTPDWIILGLTWNGHEFLEASRVDSRWQKAKSAMLDKLGTLPFELLAKYLMKLASDAMGL